jgi:predicted Zn-dependent protease
MLEVAQKALEPLKSMAQTSRNNLVQQSYHSASGAVLLAEGKFADAISELQFDPRNPLSLELLADAQKDAGDAATQQKTLAVLAAINDERVETAVAAPLARAALKATNKTTAQSLHIAGRL